MDLTILVVGLILGVGIPLRNKAIRTTGLAGGLFTPYKG